MNLSKIFSVLFFSFFAIGPLASQTNKDISIEVVHHFGGRNNITFWLYLTNHTQDSIHLLKSNPKSYSLNAIGSYPANPPEFFDLKVFPKNAICEYAVSPVGETIKSIKDFISIPPKGKREFIISSSSYDQGICDDSLKNVQVLIAYQYDKAFDSRENFNEEIRKRGSEVKDEQAADLLFKQIQKSYKGGFSSDTIEINLDSLKFRKRDEQMQFRLKAAYEYGLEFDELRFVNRRKFITQTLLDDKDLNETYCNTILDKLSPIHPNMQGQHYFRNSGNDCIIYSIDQRTKERTSFTRQEIENSLDSLMDSIRVDKIDTIFSKHEILGIYYTMGDLSKWTKGKLTQRLWVLSKSQKGEHYFTFFKKNDSPYRFSRYNKNKGSYIYKPKQVSLEGKTIFDDSLHSVFGLKEKILKRQTMQIKPNGDIAILSHKDPKKGTSYSLEHYYFIKLF